MQNEMEDMGKIEKKLDHLLEHKLFEFVSHWNEDPKKYAKAENIEICYEMALSLYDELIHASLIARGIKIGEDLDE